MVLYRKYRPQSLDELVGQEVVKQTLSSALSAGKLSHAYLFCGPKGTGKTSTARILAKMVNCKEEKVPCNNCLTCDSITDGSNLDVVEMDAASNRGIEDIRALRENIKLAPSSASKKVYIIDEVHMLSADAFNALLKTLEEPPAHVLFILATTEVQKIPQTILSRVQKLEFKPAAVEDLAKALGKIAKKEGIKIDDDAILVLAKKANGSFRDGEKLLDQLSTLGKIDRKAVEESLGLEALGETTRLLETVAEGFSEKALEKVHKQIIKGVNIKELTLSILEILRFVIYLKNGLGPSLVRAEVSEVEYNLLEKLAAKFEMGNLLKNIERFEKALEQTRYVSLPALPLEVAVLESCQEQKLSINFQVSEKEDSSQEKVDVDQISNPQFLTSSDDLQKITEKWSYVLETVRQYNYSLEALLRSVRLVSETSGQVVIEVPYSFHQRIIEAPKSKDLLESIFSEILGKSVRVTTVLKQKTVAVEELQNVELAADDEIVRLAAEIFNSETVN